jgi:two-component system cell cycle sensor histidine kinase/response regulator CckA
MERADIGPWSAREVARLMALLEAQLNYHQELLAGLPIALAIVSKDRHVLWTNRAFRKRFGTRAEHLPAKGITEIPLRAWHDEDETETLIVVGETASSALSSLPIDLPGIIWQADAATLRFRSVEGEVVALSGYAASFWLDNPKFFEERIHADDRAATLALYRGTIAAGGEASAEYRTASGDKWCRETIRAAGPTVTGVITNITSRKTLERQLLSAGRYEALYSFAGHLAHDLNNPLMIVTGYAEELMQGLKASDPLRQEASEILGAARRIGGLAAQLSDFARRQGKPASKVNLGDAILSLRSKIAAAAGERVAVEFVENRQVIMGMADPAQLGEVMTAVAAGARKSTPRERTRITISWDVQTVAERLSPTALPAGKYSCITVRDDGQGFDADQMASVFDPALSKTGDPAAGLALARAYSLVHEWGGDIAFHSEPGEGSVFTIYLPHAEPTGESEPRPVARAAAKRTQATSAAILVVDDEAGIRELMRKILQRERYRVLEAGSAEEAIATARGEDIDLVITDVMLPGIHGPELAQKMQQAAPKLKVLFISGYTGEEQVPAGGRFLAKPFTLAALLEKVREALG